MVIDRPSTLERFLQSTGGTTAIHRRVCFLCAVWPGREIWPSTSRVTARHSVFQAAKHFNHPCSSATPAKAPCPGKVRLKKGLARIMRPSHAYAKRVLAAETSPIGDKAALQSGSTAGCPAAAGTMVRFSLQRRGCSETHQSPIKAHRGRLPDCS